MLSAVSLLGAALVFTHADVRRPTGGFRQNLRVGCGAVKRLGAHALPLHSVIHRCNLLSQRSWIRAQAAEQSSARWPPFWKRFIPGMNPAGPKVGAQSSPPEYGAGSSHSNGNGAASGSSYAGNGSAGSNGAGPSSSAADGMSRQSHSAPQACPRDVALHPHHILHLDCPVATPCSCSLRRCVPPYMISS